MRIAVLGDRRMVRGFALAGIRDFSIAHDPQTARETLGKWLSDPGIGIIIIPAWFRSDLQDEIRSKEGIREGYPVVIALPGGTEEGDYSGKEYLKMAGLE